jgi:hypothetical protein
MENAGSGKRVESEQKDVGESRERKNAAVHHDTNSTKERATAYNLTQSGGFVHRPCVRVRYPVICVDTFSAVITLTSSLVLGSSYCGL